MDLDIHKGKGSLTNSKDAALAFRQAALKDTHTYAGIINHTFGIATATLTVTGQNKQALGLYHKLGFEEVDTDIILQRVKNFKN